MRATDNASGITRRRLLLTGAAALGAGLAGGVAGTLYWASNSTRFLAYVKGKRNAALGALARRVLPLEGRRLEVSFGDAIQRLVAAGVISPAKFRRLYAKRGGLPPWVARLFEQASAEPITFSFQTAPYLLNLLWPLGMATRAGFNAKSPLNGPDVHRYASTGGWLLGRAPRGGEYFNRVAAVDMNAEQEGRVLAVAKRCYRPCCNNSTFFQDCNHGSALLGLYELAAAQGADEAALYDMGRIANGYWYPDEYLEMAYFFQEIEETPWERVPSRRILGKRYSSISGWQQNVHRPLVNAGLAANTQFGAASGCGV